MSLDNAPVENVFAMLTTQEFCARKVSTVFFSNTEEIQWKEKFLFKADG